MLQVLMQITIQLKTLKDSETYAQKVTRGISILQNVIPPRLGQDDGCPSVQGGQLLEHHSVATVKKKTLLLQVVSSNYLLIPTGYLCRIDSLAFEEVFQVGHKKWTLHIHTQCRSLEMEGEEGDTAAITNGLYV